MNYSIASLLECQGNLILDLSKDGNKYHVSLYNKETKQNTFKKFDCIENAYDTFETLSKYICLGLYNENDKRKVLEV